MEKIKKCPKLDLNVTNQCNLRCLQCCFKAGEIMLKDMTTQQILNILKRFKEIGGQRVDITGGEPTMRTDIMIIIMEAINLGLKVELVTNGTILPKENLEAMQDLGLTDIAISVDGATAEKQATTRGLGTGQYNMVLHAISECVRLGFKTKINTVVFDVSLKHIVEITDLAIKLGASEHGCYYFSPIGRGALKSYEVADPLRWLKIIRQELAPREDKIKISVEVPILEQDQKFKHLNVQCYLKDPWHLQVLPDGNVYPCAIMASYQNPLGNLAQQKLRTIWEDPVLQQKGFYTKQVGPLIDVLGSCVYYPDFLPLLKSKEYQPVCLCRKFKPRELVL